MTTTQETEKKKLPPGRVKIPSLEDTVKACLFVENRKRLSSHGFRMLIAMAWVKYEGTYFDLGRMIGLGKTRCRQIVCELVDEGFLRRTRTMGRNGARFVPGETLKTGYMKYVEEEKQGYKRKAVEDAVVKSRSRRSGWNAALRKIDKDLADIGLLRDLAVTDEDKLDLKRRYGRRVVGLLRRREKIQLLLDESYKVEAEIVAESCPVVEEKDARGD